MNQDTPMTGTVFLVIDDADTRGALSDALMADGFHVKAWSAAQGFLAEYDPGEPGCVLSDIALPGTDGLELQNLLAQRDRSLPIIFIADDNHVRAVVQAMRSGAVTVLQQPVPVTELVAAIQEGLQRNLALRQQFATCAAARSRLAALTPRERQVLELVVVGKMNKQIAGQLGAAEKTIKVHRGRVMEKMEARSVAELVMLAARAGASPPAM
jgi:FixJ family two-component response regulator